MKKEVKLVLLLLCVILACFAFHMNKTLEYDFPSHFDTELNTEVYRINIGFQENYIWLAGCAELLVTAITLIVKIPAITSCFIVSTAYWADCSIIHQSLVHFTNIRYDLDSYKFLMIIFFIQVAIFFLLIVLLAAYIIKVIYIEEAHWLGKVAALLEICSSVLSAIVIGYVTASQHWYGVVFGISLIITLFLSLYSRKKNSKIVEA